MKKMQDTKKKRQFLAITVIAIFVFVSGVFVGCGNEGANDKTDETTSESEVAEGSASELTEEPVSAPALEPEKEILELSANEYYVDYPLCLEDGRKVYVKIVPGLSFYPDGLSAQGDATCLEKYSGSNYFVTALSMDSDNIISEAIVSYEIDKGYSFINYCEENKDTLAWTYEVGEPELWDNGITAYEIASLFGDDSKTIMHILYYPLNDEVSISIFISQFLGSSYLLENGELKEEHEKIMEFYRTEEKPFIIVDPETTDVVATDFVSETVAEPEEELAVTPEPTEDSKPAEKPETSKPAEEPAVTPAPAEPAQPAHTHSYNSVVTDATCANDGCITYTCSCGDTYTDKIPATGTHSYGYGEINCAYCGTPHAHDWNIVVQTNSGVEIIPDEDFCCHSGWYFDTYEELRAHMDIPNVHGMVYLNDGSNGCTSVPPDYDGPVDFYASCHGWANCAGDGEGERIEYEITQEVQFCKLCGVRGEATDVGERVILVHTYDD